LRYLLDTNVLSEPAKPRPDANVIAWLEKRTALELAISALTIGEIAQGVRMLPEGSKRERLTAWLSVDLVRHFAGRVLPVDEAVALAWGGLMAEARAERRPLAAIDGLLLATAAVHDLTLVSRNERDCVGRGVPVVNPWCA